MTNLARAIVIAAIAAGVAIAASVLGSRFSTPSEPAKTFDPTTPDARLPVTVPETPRFLEVAREAGVTPAELRYWRMHLDHELCEKGAERVNTLEGRAPTDLKGQNVLSLCLQVGNVAWYRCILLAQTADDARACSKRFLAQAPD